MALWRLRDPQSESRADSLIPFMLALCPPPSALFIRALSQLCLNYNAANLISRRRQVPSHPEVTPCSSPPHSTVNNDLFYH